MQKSNRTVRGQFIFERTGMTPHCADTGKTLGKEYGVRCKSSGRHLGWIYRNRPGRYIAVPMSGKRLGPHGTMIAAAQSMT